jgi:hypothetical protein
MRALLELEVQSVRDTRTSMCHASHHVQSVPEDYSGGKIWDNGQLLERLNGGHFGL